MRAILPILLLALTLGGCTPTQRFRAENISRETIAISLVRPAGGRSEQASSETVLGPRGVMDVDRRMPKGTFARIRRNGDESGEHAVVDLAPGGSVRVQVDVVDGHVMLRNLVVRTDNWIDE